VSETEVGREALDEQLTHAAQAHSGRLEEDLQREAVEERDRAIDDGVVR
jgi:hypothetical protein